MSACLYDEPGPLVGLTDFRRVPFEVIPLCPFVDAQTSQQTAAQNNPLRVIEILRRVAGKRAAFSPIAQTSLTGCDYFAPFR